MTLKFAAAVTGRLTMPLLDTGMSEGRARFWGMINNSERDTVRHQEELPDPEGYETMKKIVKFVRISYRGKIRTCSSQLQGLDQRSCPLSCLEGR